MSADKIYPYLIPQEYLQYHPAEPRDLARPLGHDINIALVHDLDGLVGNVTGDDLVAMGLTPDEAHQRALTNLEQSADAQNIDVRLFSDGPQQKPFIVVGGHWTAAACILLPRIHRLAKKNLGTEDVCVSIPHRDAMLLFPKGDRAYRAEMRRMIEEKEADGLKPLTYEFFTIGQTGIVPLEEQQQDD